MDMPPAKRKAVACGVNGRQAALQKRACAAVADDGGSDAFSEENIDEAGDQVQHPSQRRSDMETAQSASAVSSSGAGSSSEGAMIFDVGEDDVVHGRLADKVGLVGCHINVVWDDPGTHIACVYDSRCDASRQHDPAPVTAAGRRLVVAICYSREYPRSELSPVSIRVVHARFASMCQSSGADGGSHGR